MKRVRKAKATNTDVHKVVVKLSSSLSPTQGTLLTNYLYWQLQADPTQQSWSGSVYNSPEFQAGTRMYDQFRIKSFGMKVTPRQTVTTQSDALAPEAISGTTNVGQDRVYVVHDRDGAGPRNIALLKQYASVKTYSTKKAFNVVPYKLSNGKNWFDCTLTSFPSAFLQTGGYQGGITAYAENLPEISGRTFNTIWADVQQWFVIEFRGKVGLSTTISDPYTSYISSYVYSVVPELEGVNPAYVQSTMTFYSTIVQDIILKQPVYKPISIEENFGFTVPGKPLLPF